VNGNNNPNSPDPNDQGPSTSFYYGMLPYNPGDMAIFDFKTLTSNAAGRRPIGVACTYTQLLQIFWNDSTGTPVQPVPLKTTTWTYTGQDGIVWIPTYQ